MHRRQTFSEGEEADGVRAAGSKGHGLDRMGRDTVRGDVQQGCKEKSRGPTALKGAMS